MKIKYLNAWSKCLDVFAETSEAKRLKVAAFLFKNGNMVSHAINGTPVGWHTNECETKERFNKNIHSIKDFDFEDGVGKYRLVTKPEVLHAEEQCLEKMWHSNEITAGCEMLTSYSPCIRCATKIKSAGIVKVYYKEKYRSTEGLDYLIANGIEVEQLI